MADDNTKAASSPRDPPLTKKEAVRRVLEQEGPDATPTQLQPILKERFGFDMNLNHIATAKSKILLEAGEKAADVAAAVAAPTTSKDSAGAKPAITKLEAVRRAMQVAGDEAELELLQKLVKDEFGLDMTVKHVSTARGKIRSEQAEAEDEPAEMAAAAALKEEAPVVAAAPPPAAPEPATRNGATASATKPQGGKKAKPALTKKEAVRRAMKIAGQDATPTELQKIIKRRFDIDMNLNHISATKGDLRREMAAKEESAASARSAEAAPPAPTPPPTPAVSARAVQEDGFGLKDIQAAKELLSKLGTEQLKRLIDVLAN